MKILILSTSDSVGGAARASYRLLQSLLGEGVDSSMLVVNKESDDFRITRASKNTFQKIYEKTSVFLDQLPLKAYTSSREKSLFSPAWLGFPKLLEEIESIHPDIVHLHWICGGMLRIESLQKIPYPLVWTLHDEWAFTGGCHITRRCQKYKEGCGRCPHLGSKRKNDLSRWIWKRKEKSYEKIRKMHIVGLSKWLYTTSKSTPLLGNFPHSILPNPIDTKRFKPINKKSARQLWGLPLNKRLITFGAMRATDDPNKGFRKIYEALHILGLSDVELVIFGSSEPPLKPEFPFKIHYLGHLHDDVSLTALYNSVDVTVVPSFQENLSNTIMESLSCATPVVAFNIGGNGDMIDHLKNGYLAKPYESSDLAEGIRWILQNDKYDELCKNAREKIVRNFSSHVVATKYIELYRSILEEKDLNE